MPWPSRQSSAPSAVFLVMIKPPTRHRPITPKPIRRARPRPTPPDPVLTDEQLGLLRSIDEDPRGWHPLRQPSADAWGLRSSGLVEIDPPRPSPFESRVSWRRTYNPNPWRATITARGRRILLEQTPRIRPLAYDVELE